MTSELIATDKLPLCEEDELENINQKLTNAETVSDFTFLDNATVSLEEQFIPKISAEDITTLKKHMKKVICSNCGKQIYFLNAGNPNFVYCSNCNENILLANVPPPPGIKFIRCPCKCLIRCHESIQVVTCPRNNCNRVINIQNNLQNSPGLIRVVCGHCQNNLIINLKSSKFAFLKCPYCLKTSSYDPSRSRAGVRINIFVAFSCLCCLIIIICLKVKYTSDLSDISFYCGMLAFIGILSSTLATRFYLNSKVHSKIMPIENADFIKQSSA